MIYSGGRIAFKNEGSIPLLLGSFTFKSSLGYTVVFCCAKPFAAAEQHTSVHGRS